MSEFPLVSIFMPTYNHAPYIRQALDSCLSQKTTFPFEIIICDDCSTDGTTEIIQEYANKHSCIVHSLQKNNTGGHKNFLEGMSRIRGKYVAFCECDDFWTVPYKLEKQIRFLEENQDFSVCCHKVEMSTATGENYGQKEYIYKDLSFDDERIRDGVFYADEAIANYYFQTSSMVFRWRFSQGFPNWFHLPLLLDHALFMLHAIEGKIKYFDEVMSTWRRHTGGYTWLQNLNRGLFFRKKGNEWIKAYEEIDRLFSYRFTLQIRERILLALRHQVKNCLHTNEIGEIKLLIEEHKKYFQKPVLENAILLDSLRLALPEEREMFPPWSNHSEMSKAKINTEQDTVESKTVGGFFGLDIQSIPEVENSIWESWVGNQEYATFSTAEQALFTWLWHKCPNRRVWRPSYSPLYYDDINKSLLFSNYTYPCGNDFNPSPDFINNMQSGDAVLIFSYFGKALDPKLVAALMARPDIYWIEDRRQCLDTGVPSNAHVVIYSACELLGVPDGAILVGKGVSSFQPGLLATTSKYFFEALNLSIQRMESPDIDIKNILQHDEIMTTRQMPATACSQLTIDMLKRIPKQPIADKRKANWLYLAEHLGDYALWTDKHIDFVPFVFPIKIPVQHAKDFPVAILHTMLSNNNIFCSPLWQIHDISGFSPIKEMLLLPCDQRYGEAEMDRIIIQVKLYMSTNFNADSVKPWIE